MTSEIQATAERERIKAILGLPEANGREAAALAIALESGLTVEQAKGLLPTTDAPALRGARAGDSRLGLAGVTVVDQGGT